VKYQTTPAFDSDLRRLSKRNRDLFRTAVRDHFIPAAERYAANRGDKWPKRLRIKSVQGAAGIWEMTWSFSGPDGRATWEWVDIGSELGIRWRRVGDHSVFRNP
jgi:hypothetical protein